MSYTVNSEYCNFGRDMTTETWLSYMYRLTGLKKYKSRKSYDAYLESILNSNALYSRQSCSVCSNEGYDKSIDAGEVQIIGGKNQKMTFKIVMEDNWRDNLSRVSQSLLQNA